MMAYGCFPFHLLSERHLSPIFEETMRKFTFLLCLFLMGSTLHAQVLSLSPVFPKETDTVTIVYNAKLGNGALVGATQVYAHTGVITTLSTSGSNWRYVVGNWGTADARTKMTSLGNDKWQIRYHVKDFYSQAGTFATNETVLQLAFVFRNADGSTVGRSAAGTDIFTPIYSTGLAAKFTLPETKTSIIGATSTQKIEVWSSRICANVLTLNGDTLRKSTTKDSFQLTNNKWKVGSNRMIFTANYNNQFVAADTVTFVVNPSVKSVDPPTGLELGVTYVDDSTAYVLFYAPYKNYVYLIGDFNNWAPDTSYFMNYSSAKSIWWKKITGLKKGVEYGYQFWVDGSIRVADPFATLMLHEWDDAFIPAANYPNMKYYPKNKTQGYVGVLQTAQPPFSWSKMNFQRPATDKLLIYECLTRDFTKAQTFKALQDSIPYLKRLGITALELMPVCEFEGNLSWGYNVASQMAIDKYYGNRAALKSLVDACHQNGIAVILDVVYNHVFGSASVNVLYWDATTGKPWGNSPYLNADAKHPFNVGYDMNHESQATKYYVKRSLAYLLEEFHVDGFRFDLSKGFTQTNTINDMNKMAQYDQSRVDILTDYYNWVQSKSPGAYCIMEHFADNNEEQTLSAKGMMLWGNGNFNANEAGMGFSNSDFGYGIDAKKRSSAQRNLVGYISSHDEERMGYKCKIFGNSTTGYSVKDPNVYVPRVGLAYAFAIATPGPKMIWQFDELAYDYSINTCEDGVTVQDGCRLSNKPVRWDYWTSDAVRRKNQFKIASIAQLKGNYTEVSSPNSYNFSSGGNYKILTLNHSNMNTVVIGNFDVTSSSASVGFARTGYWYNYLTGDSIKVSGASMVVTLAAGEYRVYTDKKIANPYAKQILGGSAGAEELVSKGQMQVYPNPAQSSIQLGFKDEDGMSGEVSVIDCVGRIVLQKSIAAGESVNVVDLAKGQYWIQFTSKQGTVYSSKLMIQ